MHLELNRGLLKKDGWRVLEQRIPAKAYVIIRGNDPPPNPEELPDVLLWDGVDLPVPVPGQ